MKRDFHDKKETRTKDEACSEKKTCPENFQKCTARHVKILSCKAFSNIFLQGPSM